MKMLKRKKNANPTDFTSVHLVNGKLVDQKEHPALEKAGVGEIPTKKECGPI